MTTNPIALILRHNPKLLALTLLLTLMSMLVNVGVLMFINTHLLGQQHLDWGSLVQFLGLIGILLVMTFTAQFFMTYLGHQFVYRLRIDLVGRILTTPFADLEKTGSSRLLASLSEDIQTLNVAFVRLPELVYGIILVGGAGVYLAYLSLPLFVVIGLWSVAVVWASVVLVNRVYHFLDKLRQIGDKLYQNYQTAIHGKKELDFNHERACDFFNTFDTHASEYRQTIIKADTYHLSAVNWSNIMMFAGVGLILVLAGIGDLADKSVATTFALTVLFIQTPLLKAVGAYPVYQTAKVALKKIHELQLATQTFDKHKILRPRTWQTLTLHNVSHQYDNQSFALHDINLTFHQGEVVFLVGDNGSGKSTLAKLITGLYKPNLGFIKLDDTVITDDNRTQYQAQFAGIFGDFYLFDKILSSDEALIDTWLDLLQMKHKLIIDNHIITNTELSTGQKKRVALLLAITDDKPILLLDEWAADQDPHYRTVFYEQLIPIMKRMGKTLIVISHDDRFFRCADRVLQLKQGRLQTLATPNQCDLTLSEPK